MRLNRIANTDYGQLNLPVTYVFVCIYFKYTTPVGLMIIMPTPHRDRTVVSSINCRENRCVGLVHGRHRHHIKTLLEKL
jgi:hypothetical protein